MHLSEKDLIKYRDEEVTPAERSQMAGHLAACEPCREQLQRLESRAERLRSRLDTLGPAPGQALTPPNLARARLGAKRKQPTQEKYPMFRNKTSRKLHPALTTALAVVLLAGLFAFPAVRAAAMDFIGIFRVQQIEVVQFNPANLPDELGPQIESMMEIMAGEVQVSDDFSEEPVEAADAAEASEMLGFPVVLPEVNGEREILVQPGAQAWFEIDRVLWQAMLVELGYHDIVLPESIDGQQVTVSFDGLASLTAGGCLDDTSGMPQANLRRCLYYAQFPSPMVEAPAELPITELGQAFLQLFGMSAEEAAQFSSRVDWYNTLILPVPNLAAYEDVVINGEPGVIFVSENPGTNYRDIFLMWVEDGMVYAFLTNGSYSQAEVLRLAESLQ